jgi:hypothetical protein
VFVQPVSHVCGEQAIVAISEVKVCILEFQVFMIGHNTINVS